MENIGPFQLYTKTPNDIKYGKLYFLEVELPILYSKKRIIRVYVPEDFDPNKVYPVLMMADGQNTIDKYTTSFGAWDMDVHEHNMIEKGKRSVIIVGIDSAPDFGHRALEYSLPFMTLEPDEEGKVLQATKYEFESHLFNKYIAEELLPLVRQYFPISTKREEIGAGGASMGGIFALSLLGQYPKIFGFSLIFSPGMFLYKVEELHKYIDTLAPQLDDHKLFFYSGNKGFESKFLERTIESYNYFKSKGFDEKHIRLCTDLEAEHNEASWQKHFEEAIEFWLD